MPSLPLPRFLETQQERAQHAKVLERVVRESGANVSEERVRHAATAADGRTLRGLPAIGRGVQGCVAFTQPEQALMSKQPR